MLELLGRYFTSIAAAGLLSSIATAVVPDEGKTGVKFAGGLLVVLAVVLPLKNINGINIAEAFSKYETNYAVAISDAEKKAAQSAADMLSQLAKEDVLAYASALGISCGVEILALKDTGGAVRLYSATIEYEQETDAVEQMTLYIESMGIPRERQRHLFGTE